MMKKFGLKKNETYFDSLIFMEINGKLDQKLHWNKDKFYSSSFLKKLVEDP